MRIQDISPEDLELWQEEAKKLISEWNREKFQSLLIPYEKMVRYLALKLYVSHHDIIFYSHLPHESISDISEQERQWANTEIVYFVNANVYPRDNIDHNLFSKLVLYNLNPEYLQYHGMKLSDIKNAIEHNLDPDVVKGILSEN